MGDVYVDAVPKIHPATRELLPEDPMEMQAFEVPGDPELMMRLLVEEYARIGLGADAIVQLARNPNYTAFHALLRSLGEIEFRRRVSGVIARCGVIRLKSTETEPSSESLIQIELPTEE